MLSCTTTLGLIQPHTRFNYSPFRAILIKTHLTTQGRPRESQYTDQGRKCLLKAAIKWLQWLMQIHLFQMLVTRKEQILQSYPDVFEGNGCFPGPPSNIQIDQSITPKQTPCRPIPVHLKEAFKQKVTRYSKWEFWSWYIRPPLGSTILYLLKGRTSLEI